jgi:hypothetical protein
VGSAVAAVCCCRYAWLTLKRQLSVADQEDSVKRQRQSLTGVERRQEIKTKGEDRHRSQLAAVTEPVAQGQEQDQILCMENQARPDDVAVRRIIGRGTACLDLHDNAVVIMKGIYVVGNLSAPIAPVQDRAPALA